MKCFLVVDGQKHRRRRRRRCRSFFALLFLPSPCFLWRPIRVEYDVSGMRRELCRRYRVRKAKKNRSLEPKNTANRNHSLPLVLDGSCRFEKKPSLTQPRPPPNLHPALLPKHQAIDKYTIEKDIAAYIKKEFDRRHSPLWHCVVGRNFGTEREKRKMGGWGEERSDRRKKRKEKPLTLLLLSFNLKKPTSHQDPTSHTRPSTLSTSTWATTRCCCSSPGKKRREERKRGRDRSDRSL